MVIGSSQGSKRSRVAMLAALVLVFAPNVAAAQGPPRASFEWRTSVECVSAAEVARTVRAQLGRDALAIDDATAELRLRGRFESASDGQYRIVLELTTRAGALIGTSDRTLEPADCAELVDLVAVILAVMLNVRPEDIPEIAEPIEPSWRVRIDASAAANVGLLPLVAIEPALQVTVESPLGVLFGAEVSLDLTDEATAGRGFITAGAASARAIAGFRIGGDALELVPYAAAGGGFMWASGRGFDRNDSGSAAIVDLRAGARFAVNVAGPLWIAARAEVGFCPNAPEFGLIEPDLSTTAYFRPSLVFGAFGAGLGLRFQPQNKRTACARVWA